MPDTTPPPVPATFTVSLNWAVPPLLLDAPLLDAPPLLDPPLLDAPPPLDAPLLDAPPLLDTAPLEDPLLLEDGALPLEDAPPPLDDAPPPDAPLLPGAGGPPEKWATSRASPPTVTSTEPSRVVTRPLQPVNEAPPVGVAVTVTRAPFG
jgi:hypothetical protein